MSLRRPLILAAAALGLLAPSGLPAPAGAAGGSDHGTFSIGPSRRNVIARPPVALAPTRVSNSTRQPYDVKVFPVVLRQQLSGAFAFDETADALRTARTILGVTPAHFRLAPGEARMVKVDWNLLPLHADAAYVGIVFQGQPRLPSGRSVPVISRLLSINLLRLPGHRHRSGRFTALHVVQAGPRALRLVARVKNTGDVVGIPQHGRFIVRDAGGRAVTDGHWTGDVVVPGAEREFPIELRKQLPAGDYTARVAMRFGPGHDRKVGVRFRLASPGTLAAPAVDVTAFGAHGEVGEAARVSARIRSTGTAMAGVDLGLSVFRVTGGTPEARPVATRRLRLRDLRPGTTSRVGVGLAGPLARGSYHVVARWRDATGTAQVLTTDFAAAPHRSLLDRVHRFLRLHEGAIGAGIGAAVLFLLLLILWRRQRRLEDELRRVRAEHHAGGPSA
jgi:hypothetical protein